MNNGNLSNKNRKQDNKRQDNMDTRTTMWIIAGIFLICYIMIMWSVRNNIIGILIVSIAGIVITLFAMTVFIPISDELIANDFSIGDRVMTRYNYRSEPFIGVIVNIEKGFVTVETKTEEKVILAGWLKKI